MTFRAVAFDWRGTLVRTLSDDEWLTAALGRLGRTVAAAEAARLVAVLGSLAAALDEPGTDSSAVRHRDTYLGAFRRAGLDGELAGSLYAVESDTAHNRYAADAAPTLHALAGAGVRVAVVSDVLTLSFETGLQKPDPRVFVHTLERLGTRAGETLMVGDRAVPDGGAVAVGMPTLLLPPLTDVRERRLWPVLRMRGIP